MKGYSNAESKKIEEFLCENFGKIKTFFGDLSDESGLKIAVSEPTDDMPYYKVFSVGMGANAMNVPKQYQKIAPDRIELGFYLDKSWDVEKMATQMEFGWPIEILKKLSKYPFKTNSWLAHEHTLNNQNPLCDYVDYTAMLLLSAISSKDFIPKCSIGIGKKVGFVIIYPIFKEEYEFKVKNSSLDLINIIDDVDFPVVKQTRENYGIGKV